MRLQCDTPLLPNEPVVMEFPAPRELREEAQVYWSPATVELDEDEKDQSWREESCEAPGGEQTEAVEGDTVRVKFTAPATQQPVWSEATQRMVIRQVVLNPTGDVIHLPQGTPMGWIEAAEVLTMQELLHKAAEAEPARFIQVITAQAQGDASQVMSVLEAMPEGVMQSALEAIEVDQACAWSEDDLAYYLGEAPRVEPSSKVSHKPKFELPEHHRYYGMTRRQMVEHVSSHGQLECDRWYAKHSKKLFFGEQLGRGGEQQYIQLLFALQEVFAENPKAHQ